MKFNLKRSLQSHASLIQMICVASAAYFSPTADAGHLLAECIDLTLSNDDYGEAPTPFMPPENSFINIAGDSSFENSVPLNTSVQETVIRSTNEVLHSTSSEIGSECLDDSICILYENLKPPPDIQVVNEVNYVNTVDQPFNGNGAAADSCCENVSQIEPFVENSRHADVSVFNVRIHPSSEILVVNRINHEDHAPRQQHCQPDVLVVNRINRVNSVPTQQRLDPDMLDPNTLQYPIGNTLGSQTRIPVVFRISPINSVQGQQRSELNGIQYQMAKAQNGNGQVTFRTINVPNSRLMGITASDRINELPTSSSCQPNISVSIKKQGDSILSGQGSMLGILGADRINQGRNGVVESSSKKKKNVECGICFDSLDEISSSERKLVSTVCGHIFCDECLKSSMQASRVCPTCRKRLTAKQFHPLYL